jgi:predicted transcriptional regulator
MFGGVHMTKQQLVPLSRTETEILRIVWQLEKAAVQEVYDTFPRKRRVSFATVQTLLRRLEKKGYLRHTVRGNANLYHTAVNMESVLKKTVNDFLERVFGGDPVPLMLHLAKHGKLTAEDIKKLMELIEE